MCSGDVTCVFVLVNKVLSKGQESVLTHTANNGAIDHLPRVGQLQVMAYDAVCT